MTNGGRPGEGSGILTGRGSTVYSFFLCASAGDDKKESGDRSEYTNNFMVSASRLEALGQHS